MTTQRLTAICSASLICAMLVGCDVKTTVVKPQDFYDISLSADIKNKANRYKDAFIESKLEDEEVDDDLSEEQKRRELTEQYERAINALYVGNVRSEKELHLVLDLVEFSTDVFKENAFSDQLEKRSRALSDFMIDYQINAALSSKDNQMWDEQIEEQGAVMAQQQSEYEILKSRFERLQRSEENLREQLEEAELKLAEAQSTNGDETTSPEAAVAQEFL